MRWTRKTIVIAVVCLLLTDSFFIAKYVLERNKKYQTLPDYVWNHYSEEVFDVELVDRSFTFDYRLMRPGNLLQEQSYPLVVFLHGAGERGTDNYRQLKSLPALMARQDYRNRFPCYLLAPQCPRNLTWTDLYWYTDSNKNEFGSTEFLEDLLSHVIQENQIDPSRVYLVGFSMGAIGTWHWSAVSPDQFAAAIPVSGWGDPTKAENMNHLPIWVFHGEQDQTISVEKSRQMVSSLRAAGGNPKYDEYPDAGHNVIAQTFADRTEVLEWLFQQKR